MPEERLAGKVLLIDLILPPKISLMSFFNGFNIVQACVRVLACSAVQGLSKGARLTQLRSR